MKKTLAWGVEKKDGKLVRGIWNYKYEADFYIKYHATPSEKSGKVVRIQISKFNSND